MVDRLRVRHDRRRAPRPEVAQARPGRQGLVPDQLVHHVHPGVVIVGEPADHTVVGPGQLPDPDRHPEPGQVRIGLRPGGPARVVQGERVQVVGDVHGQHGAHHGYRPPDDRGDRGRPRARDRVHGPQRRVDRPEKGGQRRLVRAAGRARGLAGPGGGVGGHHARGEQAERALGRGQALAGRGVGAQRPARGRFPGHAAARRLGDQLAERRAVGAEYLDALVHVVRQQEPGHRADLAAGVHLVDHRVGRAGRVGGLGADQPQPAAGRRGDPRRPQHGRLRTGHDCPLRHDRARRVEIQQPAEGVHYAQPGQRDRAAGQQDRQPGRGRRQDAAVRLAGRQRRLRQAEQHRPHAVAGHREQVEPGRSGAEGGDLRGGAVVHLAGVIPVPGLFGGQPGGHRPGQPGAGRRGEVGPAGDRDRRARQRAAGPAWSGLAGS